jgi:adenylate cyclase
MLLPAAACAKLAKGELADLSELVQQMLELADGDPLRGGAVIESPLTLALWFRALTAMCRGAKGWQAEMMSAAEMVREFTPLGEPDVMFWKYGFGVLAGAVRPDAAAIAHTADILAAANQRGDDHLVSSATFSHGFVLAQQPQPIRARGMKLLADVRASNFSRRGFAVVAPLIDTEFAKEKALQGNIDEAIDELRTLAEREVGLNAFGPFGRAAELVVELLLQRDGPQDLAAAQEVIDLVAAVPTEPGIVIYEVALLRLRALVAQARGDEAEYRQYRDRYRAMANEIGYEGHIAIADAMT